MGQDIERFPLFPLGLVLLPGELVPLHIFEERYKQMIGECLDEEREFGTSAQSVPIAMAERSACSVNFWLCSA
jgi:Lon protease-like protein